MDDETLKALVGSIKKWTAIARGKGEDEGHENCPLCLMFLFNSICGGCPVNDDSWAGCYHTPYSEWVSHYKKIHDNRARGPGLCPECERLAWKEVWFLCTLLPGEEVDDE